MENHARNKEFKVPAQRQEQFPLQEQFNFPTTFRLELLLEDILAECLADPSQWLPPPVFIP
jgi:hypothetical protein